MLRTPQREKDRRHATKTADERTDSKTQRQRLVAKHDQIHRQYHKRDDNDNRLRCDQLKHLEIAHGWPPFSNRSNKGDLRHGSIQSSNKLGHKPINSAVPISSAAPIRSGTEIGSIGCSSVSSATDTSRSE